MAIRASTEEGVLEVVIDDAARGNVVSLAWVADMRAALAELGPDVGCLLLRSEGRNFGLGGDVATFAGDDPAGDVGRLVEGVHEISRQLAALEIPLVIAVQGWAAGVGMSLALMGDVVLAGVSTRFKTAYAGIGLVADGGLTWTLPRRLPHALALDLLLTDRALTAAEALAHGIVSRVSEDEELVEDARRLARTLAVGPREAHRAVKRLVRDGRSSDLHAQLDAEAAAMVAAVVSPEGREGVEAFLARRAPDFASTRSPRRLSTRTDA